MKYKLALLLTVTMLMPTATTALAAETSTTATETTKTASEANTAETTESGVWQLTFEEALNWQKKTVPTWITWRKKQNTFRI